MIDLVRLHHVSFAIQDLEASKRFYSEVLGLKEIDRPAFQFPGAWYALGDRQLHLIQEPVADGQARSRISRSDHVALEVRDMAAVKRDLSEADVEFREGSNQSLGIDQVFCRDPDGHMIEFVRYLKD